MGTRRYFFWMAILVATARAARPQSPVAGDVIGLREIPFQELVACYADVKKCGVTSTYAISDEFERRLPNVPTDRLVKCLVQWKACGVEDDRETGWPVSEELARRKYLHPLLVRYWHENDFMMRNGIEHVAYAFDNSEVAAFMKRILAKRIDDGEDRYWPVNYLARQCYRPALYELSTGRYRGQGSLQYQSSVELFGKCTYRHAVPYLVDEALYDFSLNIVDAAEKSLDVLMPTSQKFQSLEEEQAYYCHRARKEGFEVTCKARH